MYDGYENRQQLPPRDHAVQLEACISSFFCSAAEIELVTGQAGMHRDQSDKNITVIINFEGLEQGFLALNISETLAHHLVVCMLGDVEELNDSCLFNTLGETANILALSLLESLPEKHCHSISMPAIIRDDDTLVQKLLRDNRGYTCSLFHGTERVLVKFVIHPPDCMISSLKPNEQAETTRRQAHRLFSCPRFGHPCRREQTCETSSPHTVRGIPHVIRQDFKRGIQFDSAP